MSAPQALIEKIMLTPVPSKGQLINPVKSSSKTRQVSISDFKSNKNLPDNINDWQPKHFAIYFADKFKEKTNSNYHVNYRSDIPPISVVIKRMKSQGLNANEFTRKYIDWVFDNFIRIKKRVTIIAPATLPGFTNEFYQSIIMPMVEKQEVIRNTNDASLLDEINEAYNEGKVGEIFVRFGIPVAATYFVRKRNVKTAEIIVALEERFAKLANNNIAGKEQLSSILIASILGSPYPNDFELLEWRDLFEKYTEKFHFEDWWRDNDYKGKPLDKYNILGSHE
jgi:hypothetical protein